MIAITVVIPAKNEEGSIGSLVERVRKVDRVSEVLVVDDGSSDATAAVAMAAGAHVVSHPYSKGNGAAIKTGSRAARTEWLVFMDADGQHQPEDIPSLIEQAEQGFDLVVGARRWSQQASQGRAFANAFYNRLSSMVVGQNIQDLTSGFRLVRRAAFMRIIDLLPNGFSYPTTSTMLFFRIGYNVAFAPVNVLQRDGKGHIKPLSDGIRFLLIIFKIATLYSPLKLFVPLAFLHFVGGMGRYFYTYLTSHSFTNMSALLLSASVIIFLMGLLSEQLTSLSMLSLSEEED